MTTQGPAATTQQDTGSLLKPGIYSKCRGVAGSAKHGFSSKDTPEITINVKIPIPEGGHRVMTVVLYFSAEAAKYSMERLRALGWKGTDIRVLDGIDTQDVDIEVTYDMYEGKVRPKVQIMGGGTFETRKPAAEQPGGIDAWAARVNALAGIDSTGGSENGGGPAPKPDF